MGEPFGTLPLALALADGRVDGHSAARLTAAGVSLLQHAAPLVRALTGKRSAILLPPGPGFLVALAASEGRGAVLVDPGASAAETSYQIADAGVGAAFTIARLAPRLPAGLPYVLLDEAPDHARWIAPDDSRLIDLREHRGLTVEGDADAPGSTEEATVVYTSAMEGWPLGAIATHRNLLTDARAMIDAAGLTEADHSLAALPFSRPLGLLVPGLATLLAGGRVTTTDPTDPAETIERLERDPITVLVGVPSMFAAMTAALARRGRPLTSPHLRVCVCGGAPLSESLQDLWFGLTRVELRQAYGLSEAGPVCLFNRVQLANHRGRLGTPLAQVEVSVRDPESGDSLGDGAQGEICVAGDVVSPGYVGRGEAGLARRGRWLHTGDLGTRHADGTFSFEGVLKPMFTRDGVNIYPRELERVVSAMPGVRRATVRPIPEPLHENEILLEVVGDVDEAAVREWCELRLAAGKRPGRVVLGAWRSGDG